MNKIANGEIFIFHLNILQYYQATGKEDKIMDLNLGEVQKTSPPPHCSSWELAVYVALGGFLSQGEGVATTGICSCNHEDCHQKQTVGQALEGWYK